MLRSYSALFGLLLTICITSCQPSAVPAEEGAAQADSLSYQIKAIDRSLACKDSSQQEVCLDVHIEKLVFEKGSSEAARRKINQFMSKQISETDNAETDARTPEQVADNLVAEYQQITSEMPGYKLPWEYKRQFEVYLNKNGLLGIMLNAYSFTGGAHPVSFDYYFTFDSDNGSPLSLEKLVVPAKYSQLVLLAERKFIVENEVDTSLSYSDAGYWFEDDTFALPENYRYSEKGLKFHFNPYDIGPYSDGPREISFPYRQIAPYIKPEYRF